jgi:hypothetical protein
MILEAKKVGKVKDWRFLLKCEDCGIERWITAGGNPENKKEHPCVGCKSKRNWKDPQIVEKRKQTCLDKYGSTNSFQSPKTKETVLKKFGVDSVLKSKDVREKIKKSCLDNNGHEFPLQSEKIQEKFKSSMLQKYGVEHALQSDEIKSRMDFKEAWKKKHKTDKENGNFSFTSSKIEERFFIILKSLYKVVERQVIINDKWSIDFYIRDIDTFVQFDGVYWHGLNRPLEEISKSLSPRDKRIIKGYFVDLEQNEWFEKNNLKLLRITDKEFENGSYVKKLASFSN